MNNKWDRLLIGGPFLLFFAKFVISLLKYNNIFAFSKKKL
jgi:hypothetical protein